MADGHVSLDKQHQSLLHEFLDFQYLSADELKELVEDIFPDPSQEQDAERKVRTLNSVIKTFKMEIERTMNDLDGSTQYVLVNLEDGEMMQRSKTKPKTHWEFLEKILGAVIEKQDHFVNYTDALNLRLQVEGGTPGHLGKLDLETADRLIKEWIDSHILERDEDEQLFLGFVGIAEFRQIISIRLKDAVCTVCHATCLRGKECLFCHKKLHETCYSRLCEQNGSSIGLKCLSCNRLLA